MAENPSLKAVLALWRQVGDQPDSRRTIEDQLADLSMTLNYDLMVAFDASQQPIGGVVRRAGKAVRLTRTEIPLFAQRLVTLRDGLYTVTTAPINIDAENLGTLSVGKIVDGALLPRDGVLTRAGKVIQSNLTSLGTAEIEAGLSGCAPSAAECVAELRGETYLIMAVDNANLGSGFAIWSVQSIDATGEPLVHAQAQSLLAAAAGMLSAALLVALFASRRIARPLTDLIERLKQSERTGSLGGGYQVDSPPREVNELAAALNLAAAATTESQRRLEQAYLEFTQTMAQTLDTRDTYTAGHSTRVSQYACAVADALHLPSDEKEIVRIGATLHDIGKIGVPDAVLQKPGKLTAAEFEMIKKHPLIGRKILEGVARFRDYLAIVELHHENHDGTGYPWGLAGDKIPLAARIVHVVDAYDAMTTSRPYRDAMLPHQARDILQHHAGTQFDPAIVEVFLQLVRGSLSLPPGISCEELAELSTAVGARSADYADLRVSDVH
jgi:hypothetical protein